MSETNPVWSVFTKVRDGMELQFRIQELPSEKFADLFELFYTHFVPDEALHKASRIAKREESFNEYKQILPNSSRLDRFQMDACYLEDDSDEPKLVGGSIMVLENKEDPEFDLDGLMGIVKTEEIKNLLKIVKFKSGLCNVKEKYNLDRYFDDRGITVHRDYRRLGIAGELLKSRAKACKHYGVPMTGAWMTSFGTQKAAPRVGWETICEISYDECAKVADVTFEGTPPTSKLMVIKA